MYTALKLLIKDVELIEFLGDDQTRASTTIVENSTGVF
jgi:hypothetical protein